jgi:hypothetical protein
MAAAQTPPLSLAYSIVPGAGGQDTVLMYFRNNTNATLQIGSVNTSIVFRSACNAYVLVANNRFAAEWGSTFESSSANPVTRSYAGVAYNRRWQYGNTSPNILSPTTVPLTASGYFELMMKVVFANNGCGTPAYLENRAENIANDITNQLGQRIAYNIVNDGGSFPVEWLSFDAFQIGKSAARLEWITATEFNNARFDIERSLDGQLFEKIGEVAGAGNSQEARSYYFVDGRALGQTLYYRLRQVDIDGSFHYSEIRQVNFSGQPGYWMIVYPNPADAVLTIETTSANRDSHELTLTDGAGKVVLHVRDLRFVNGRYELPVEELAAGLYQLRLSSAGSAEQFSRSVYKR